MSQRCQQDFSHIAIVDAVDEHEEFLSHIKAITSADEYGPNLNESIAARFMSILKQESNKEELEAVLKTLLVPENCKLMGTTKINPELWPQLPQRIKMKDIKLQAVQRMVSKTLVSNARVTELMMNYSKVLPAEFLKSALELLVAGTNAAAMAQKEISYERKMEIKPYLNSDFATICSDKTLQSEFLFGSGLVETLKATKAASNVVKSVGNRGESARIRPLPYTLRGRNLNWRGRRQFRGGGQFRGTSRGHYNQKYIPKLKE